MNFKPNLLQNQNRHMNVIICYSCSPEQNINYNTVSLCFTIDNLMLSPKMKNFIEQLMCNENYKQLVTNTAIYHTSYLRRYVI